MKLLTVRPPSWPVPNWDPATASAGDELPAAKLRRRVDRRHLRLGTDVPRRHPLVTTAGSPARADRHPRRQRSSAASSIGQGEQRPPAGHHLFAATGSADRRAQCDRVRRRGLPDNETDTFQSAAYRELASSLTPGLATPCRAAGLLTTPNKLTAAQLSEYGKP